MNSYLMAMNADKEEMDAYYKKSQKKTEQQKFLETLVRKKGRWVGSVVDLACGAGTLSYHMAKIYPEADFYLVDYNESALNIARTVCIGERFKFFNENISSPSFPSNTFDLVFSAMTLGWIDRNLVPSFLYEIVRVLKPGRGAYLTSLFNLERDVDLFTQVVDHTRSSGKEGLHYDYNTYSLLTIKQMLKDVEVNIDIVPFDPHVDFNYSGRGIGTSTLTLQNGHRIQVSGGMLLNWGCLIIEKSEEL
jgi:ubiquinone/menaquinone biosynthesis C-methylase UbiE